MGTDAKRAYAQLQLAQNNLESKAYSDQADVEERIKQTLMATQNRNPLLLAKARMALSLITKNGWYINMTQLQGRQRILIAARSSVLLHTFVFTVENGTVHMSYKTFWDDELFISGEGYKTDR